MLANGGNQHTWNHGGVTGLTTRALPAPFLQLHPCFSPCQDSLPFSNTFLIP